MCKNKMSFQSRSDARKELSKLSLSSRRGADHMRKMKIYKCDICSLFHLTSLSKRVIRLKGRYQSYEDYKARYAARMEVES